MVRNIFTRLSRRELRAAQYDEIAQKAKSVKVTLSVLPGCREQKATEAGMKARASRRRAEQYRAEGSYVAAFEWDIRAMHYDREGSLFSNPDCDYNVLAEGEVEIVEAAFETMLAKTRIVCDACFGTGFVTSDVYGRAVRCEECGGHGSMRRLLEWYDSPNGQTSRSTRLRGVIQGVVCNERGISGERTWYAFLVASTTLIVQREAGKTFHSKEDAQMWVEREIYDFVKRLDYLYDIRGERVSIENYPKGGRYDHNINSGVTA